MKLEFSAGGIVIQKSKISFDPELNTEGSNQKSRLPRPGTGGQAEIIVLVCQHSQHHGWVFPKGLINDHDQNETKEQTALREVEEETGIKGKILQSLSPVKFWYEWKGEKINKTVFYYLMEFVGGDITKHDWEMENVEWLPEDQVEERLTYESDKKVWQEAKQLIVNRE